MHVNISMGKIRKVKNRLNHFVNPLGHDPEKVRCAQPNEYEQNPIEAIREQLQSIYIEEKINGLQAIAVLTEHRETVQGIFDCDVVKIIAAFLCDKDEALQNAATGALRTLSVTSAEISGFLINQDVVSPLLKMLCEFADDFNWVPKFDSSMNNQPDLKTDTFLQGINLLWILLECDPSVVDLLNRTTLLANVIKCLNYNVYGFEVAITVGQLLLIATENNPKCWQVLRNNILTLLDILNLEGDSSHIYLRTLCAGVVSNVSSVFDVYAENVIQALSRTLEKNSENIFREFQNELLQEKNQIEFENQENMDTIEESEEEAKRRRRFEELPSKRDIELKKLEYILEAQRLAVETITNICFLDDEVSDDLFEPEFSQDSESESDSALMETGSESLKTETKQLFLSNFIIQRLWQLTNKINVDDLKNQCEEKKLFFRKREQLRVEALVCIQNLCNIFNCDELGGANFLYGVWVDLGQQVFQGSNEFCVLEPTTALMRSILGHLRNRGDLFSQMTENDLQLILNGVNICLDSEIRANWLRMLGTLGNMISNELAELIIKLIIDVCEKEEDIWPMTEAIDSLMDLFYTDERNQLILSLNLVGKVKNIQAICKKKFKQQKHQQATRKSAIVTVLHNLNRFISYIEKENIKLLRSQ